MTTFEILRMINKALNFNSPINQSKGRDIVISNEIITELNEYIEANKTLLDCVNADCYIINETRKLVHSRILLN